MNKGVFFKRIRKAIKGSNGMTVHEISDILKTQKTHANLYHKNHPTTRQIGQILSSYPQFKQVSMDYNGTTILGHATKIGLWKLSTLGEEE